MGRAGGEDEVVGELASRTSSSRRVDRHRFRASTTETFGQPRNTPGRAAMSEDSGGGRHLVEERLEEMVVAAVHDRDVTARA
jgi:hypothetical protein